MNGIMSYAELSRLGRNPLGTRDPACPVCGPGRRPPMNRRRKSPYQAENKRLERLRRQRTKLATKWKSVDAQISGIESRKQARRREQAATRAVASSRLYRDGTPRNMPGHAEVARRYSWYTSTTRKTLPSRIGPGRTGSSKLMTRIRLRELERLFSSRHGKFLQNSNDGRNALEIAAHHIVHLGPDAERHIRDWARVWAPWMSTKRVASLISRVMSRPARFKADTLAWRLQVTPKERDTLALTTIGAVGQTPQIRRTLRRVRRRRADRLRRRRRGAKPREEYEATSLTRTKPWEALRMSRRTWYRRGRDRTLTSLPRAPQPSPNSV
jgi:hypothetical protein